MSQIEFMEVAVMLSLEKMQEGNGGPFGAVVVKDGKIIGVGYNQVTSTNDPTAHAEIVAIREACAALNTFELSGCDIYTSCEPCPMCMSAIHWAKPDKVYYSNTMEQAAQFGFADKKILDQLNAEISDREIPLVRLEHKEALSAFKLWEEKDDKIEY